MQLCERSVFRQLLQTDRVLLIEIESENLRVVWQVESHVQCIAAKKRADLENSACVHDPSRGDDQHGLQQRGSAAPAPARKRDIDNPFWSRSLKQRKYLVGSDV